MGVQERKARQKRFLRQEILDAATDLFVNEGFERVSMRRIADKIEYSPTTIYLYFKDKAELLDQICTGTFARLAQHLTRMLEQPGDPLERLKRGLLAYINFGIANPQQYRVVFMMPPPEGFDRFKNLQQGSPGMQSFDFLRRSVFDCISAGKFRSRHAELIAQTLWCGVHGVTSLLITHQMFPWVDKERLIQSTVDALVAGVSV